MGSLIGPFSPSLIGGADVVAAGSAAFSPSSLSPALWIEAASSTLYQSNAGSGAAASANGDVIGYVTDLSGNGFDLSAAANDTTRPTLQGVGSFPYLSFDGSNDVLRRLSSLGMYAAGATSIFMAMRGNPAAGSRAVAEASTSSNNPIYDLVQSDGSTPSRSVYFLRNDANTAIINNAGVAQVVFDNADTVFGVTDSGSVITPYRDSTAATTTSYSRSGAVTPNVFGLGALVRASASGWFAMRCYGLVIVNRVLTSTERANLTTYLGNLAGLTL